MRKHLKYLRYVVRHKWYVFCACLEIGVPLHQAVLHDWTKFLPSEWFPYVEKFYGPKYPSAMDFYGDERNRVLDSGRYKERVQSNFDVAWLRHQHRSPHHWQHWILRNDSGAVTVLKMPRRYTLEMVADWKGAGRAITGKDEAATWYLKNRERMTLHPDTRDLVESLLGVQQCE